MLPFLSRLGRKVHIPDVRQAFRATFRNPLASTHVLPDIAEFCHANEAVPEDWNDIFGLGRWTGRQDVWLRIREYLDLTDEEIHDIRRGQSILRDGVKNGVE